MQKHGVTAASGSLLTAPNGDLWTTAGGYLQAFSSEGWNPLEYTVQDDWNLYINNAALLGDSILATTNYGYYSAALTDLHFTFKSPAPFNNQSPTAASSFDGVQLMGTPHPFSGATATSIFHSTDNGASYLASTFNNAPTMALGGSGQNFIQHFYQAGSVLMADMSAGFAHSSDNGATWTFEGTIWDNSVITGVGNNMYAFYLSGIWGESRSMIHSSDGGETWQDMAFAGMPGGEASDFAGYFGVYQVNGQLYTLHVAGEGSTLYSYNPTESTWFLVEGSEGPFDESLQSLSHHDGDLVGSWYFSGIWKNGEVTSGAIPAHLGTKRNAATGMDTARALTS